MNNHGTPFEGRFGLMRERIEAMQAIWTAEEAEYHGKRVDFDPIFMWPKPVQKPHPPIHVGGAFPGGAKRAPRYGNGWIPIGGRDDELAAQIPEYRKLAEEAGRGPGEVSIYGAAVDDWSRYQDAGADRVVLGLPPAPRDKILPILDHYAQSIG